MWVAAWAPLGCLSATTPDPGPAPRGGTALADALPRLRPGYGALSAGFHSPARLSPLQAPRWVAWNHDLGQQLGFGPGPSDHWLPHFHGEAPWPGAQPLAMAYAGHQFGTWVPRLGDGRAVLLGSLHDGDGGEWELHIKGGGPTEYSRGADGRAVLRSSVREYLCSEAMHGLGVPTTRALGLLAFDSQVQRETLEPAAMLARVARSHVRFGHFEWAASALGPDALRELGEYVLARFHPDLPPDAPGVWLQLLGRVVRATAETIAAWHCWGFCHGVMNTDNMSIAGDTIDYGPYGFLDDFVPGYTPNLTDSGGRYAFRQQAAVGLWNCRALASAMLPLLAQDCAAESGVSGQAASEKAAEKATGVLDEYGLHFWRRYMALMARRLGLRAPDGDDALPQARTWLESTLQLMAQQRCDYHLFFRALAEDPAGMDAAELRRRSQAQDGDDQPFANWLEGWRGQLGDGAKDPGLAESMQAHNPVYVLRQSWAQLAIEDAAQGGDLVQRYAGLLASPWQRRPGFQHLEGPPPPQGRGLQLSCSS